MNRRMIRKLSSLVLVVILLFQISCLSVFAFPQTALPSLDISVAAPSNLQVISDTADGVAPKVPENHITWKLNSSNETGVRIYRMLCDPTTREPISSIWEIVATLPSETVSYTDRGDFSFGWKILYKVAAFNESSSAETAEVTVFTPDQTDVKLPVVTGVFPLTGPISGGTEISVEGSNFDSVKYVTFNELADIRDYLIVNPGKLVLKTPSVGTPQNVHISVTTEAGRSSFSSKDMFSYTAVTAELAVPKIISIEPSKGPEEGSTYVTIYGSGFTKATGVKFGDVSAKTYTVQSDTEITAITPSGKRDVNVTVITKSGNSEKNAHSTFSYEAPSLPVAAPASKTATSVERTVIIFNINSGEMSVNGVQKPVDPGRETVPVIDGGRTLVPIRALAENLGGTVSWDAGKQQITAKLGEKVVELWIGSKKTTVNGESKETDVAPVIINGRTMLPLRFVTENLGCNVEWNEKTQSVVVTN